MTTVANPPITQSIAGLLPATATSGAGGASPSSGSTSTNIAGAQQSLAGDQQTFLKLLTTQLKNQDPTSPMNTDQFTQQLVSMTGVQQQILTNELLQQLVGNQTGVGDPVSLLGKTITATSSQATLQGGQANWLYSTAANAKDVQLQVTNSLGQVVYTSDAGTQTPGEHAFTWNGKDRSGVQLPDGGPYTLAVKAVDSSGAPVSARTYLRGPVTAVDKSGGQVLLTVNGAQIPANAISSVGAGQ